MGVAAGVAADAPDAARGAAAGAGAAPGFRRNEAQIPPTTANTTPDQMNVDMIVPTAPGESVAPAVPAARAAMTFPASAAIAGERRDRLQEVVVDEGAEPEAHHDHPAAEAALVREPLRHRGDRGHVPDAEAEAAEDAVGDVDPGRAELAGAEAGEDVRDPPQHDAR